jgi:hypothetical protein
MLHWRDEQGIEHQDRVKPLGLQTRQGEEFLQAGLESGVPVFIRLDRILSMK